MYPYTDLDRYAWYHDGVHCCIGRGFMIGYGDNTFRPDRFITRAELVQVFFNMEKQPAATADLSGYKDLDPTQWYMPAIRWAVENKLIDGFGDGTMRPNEPITREQIAAVYMRYSAWKGYSTGEGADTSIPPFPDYDDISKWAIPYVQWAVGAGLMVGRDDNGVPYLTPPAGTMRSEAATLQMRFCEKHGI